jgi:hypothetical protein
MAKQKLSEDYIKWTLSIDASVAQQSIHALSKEIKDLTKQNKEHQKRMIELEAEGKKGSKEYSVLTDKIKVNNEAINFNRLKIDALTKSMGLNHLTMNQLTKMAKDLQKQLNNTSKALHPEEYARLEKELAGVRGRMAELKEEGVRTHNSLGSIIGRYGTMAVAGGNILTRLLSAIGNGIRKFKEFTKAGIEAAGQAQGITHAFERMAGRDDLKKLREDTKGLLTDLTLMKSAVRAEHFNIPLEQMGKYLLFAQERAKDTGENIDYLVNSIVNGIGRKSKLILDNVGISATRLAAEVKKTGDFAQAVSHIVDEEMAKVGDSISTAAETATRRSVALQNLQTEWGRRWVGVKEAWDKMVTGMLEDLAKLIKVEKSHKDEYEDQIKKVADLEVNTASLIERYNTLKGKETLLTEETVELNKIIDTLRATVPGIVTEWDEYGRAISIDTQKVLDFIEAQKAMLLVKNRAAIEEQTKALKEHEAELKVVEARYKSGMKTVTFRAEWGGTVERAVRPLNADELKADETRIEELKQSILGEKTYLDELNGTTIEAQVEAQTTIISKRKEFYDMEKAQLAEYIKLNEAAADKYIEIAREVQHQRFGNPEEDGGDTDEEKKRKAREAAAAKKAAEELRLKEIENAHARELSLLKKRRAEGEMTEEDHNAAVYAADISFYEKRIAALEEFKKKTTDKKSLADYEKQIIDAQSHIMDAEASAAALSLTALQKKRDESLRAEEDMYTAQKTVYAKAVAEKEITRQQYDAVMLSLDAATSLRRLDIYKEYQKGVVDMEKSTGTLKAKAVEEAGRLVMAADLKAAQDRAAQQKQLQTLLQDFKAEFKITTVGEDLDLQLKTLEETYKARKEMAAAAGMDTLALDEAYERARTQILREGEDARYRIRQQYGLVTMQDEWRQEEAVLRELRDQGLLSEEEYQASLLNVRTKFAKKYQEYVGGIVSGAVDAFQDAEIANIDARYDAEIAGAEGNKDEIERLEKEKEAKKLAVQKKYAGVQFAIKVSEIIANTSVAIMQALAQLGPIAGAIAGVVIGATGVAQIAKADAERRKVMAMTVEGGSSTGSGARVATGREKGGYVDVERAQDGRRFHAAWEPSRRGYVDKPTVIVGEAPGSREWVAGDDALQNPTVAPIINILDEAQNKGEIRTIDMNRIIRRRLAGFDRGGYISGAAPSSSSPSPSPSPGPREEDEATALLISLLKKLDREGVPAFIVQSEYDREQARLEQARKIGSR